MVTPKQKAKLPPALLKAVSKGKRGAAGSTKAAAKGGRKSPSTSSKRKR